ncbi:5'-3' exonuclease [Clostridium porci]|uniref:5'-3' exonuclease n=1 Tax=Clostridium porci TaxID=2605778 RepID=A0A7X2NKP9_9CLOT|nr:5'-3' exonuclease H3TH domain-containing protein [Clostridium porci]MSS36573.1 5'-3' exonuclease [Clostridium porci]
MQTRPLFLIIDGSSLLSTNYYALLPFEIKTKKTEEERKPLYDKLMHATDGTYTNGIYGMSGTLVQLLKDLKPDYMAVVFDKTRNTFRRELYPDYKGQRKETPAPLKEQFVLMQQILRESGIRVLVHDSYEADDLAATLVERSKQKARVRLLTKDRDYLQLVEDEYDVRCWITAEKEKADTFRNAYGNCFGGDAVELPRSLKSVMEFTGASVYGEKGVTPNLIPDLKGIEGDASDNIPGVRGVSSAAAPLLMEYQSMEGLYQAIEDAKTPKEEKELSAFWKEKLGISRSPLKTLKEQKDIALLSKNLATIRRDVPIIENMEDCPTVMMDSAVFNDWMKRLDIKTVEAPL